MVKDLKYYLSLPYTTKVEKLSEEDGGGIFLSIPDLGSAAVNGCGDTYEEAEAMLNEVKEDVLALMLADGVEIPEPKQDIPFQPMTNYVDLFHSGWNKFVLPLNPEVFSCQTM